MQGYVSIFPKNCIYQSGLVLEMCGIHGWINKNSGDVTCSQKILFWVLQLYIKVKIRVRFNGLYYYKVFACMEHALSHFNFFLVEFLMWESLKFITYCSSLISVGFSTIAFRFRIGNSFVSLLYCVHDFLASESVEQDCGILFYYGWILTFIF